MYLTNSPSVSHGIQPGQLTDNDRTYGHESCPLDSLKFTTNPNSDSTIPYGLTNSFVKRTSNWDTKDEELLLKLFLMYFGNDWAQYRQFFPTRTVDSIKSKFHNLVRATNRKRSKIHCKTHQNIVVMVKRAQELMKDEVKRGQIDSKHRAYNLASLHAANKNKPLETIHEQPQMDYNLSAPSKPPSPAKLQLNDLPLCPFQLPCAPLSPSHPLPRHSELCGPAPLLLHPHNRPMHPNIPQLRQPMEFSASSKNSPRESSAGPFLYIENGSLFSTPINYFGSITLPFVFSELGASISPAIYQSPQRYEESKPSERPSTTVGPVKLEEGSYLNAMCIQCGSTQTLRIRKVDGILAFNSLYREDVGGLSVPNSSNPIQNIICACPVCTSSAELVKEADKYVWRLRCPATPHTSPHTSPRTLLESSSLTSTSIISTVDQISSASCQCPTKVTQMGRCDDDPPFYQNFELDSTDCFSTSTYSSSTHLGVNTSLGGLEAYPTSNPDSTIWSNTSMPADYLNSSINNRTLDAVPHTTTTHTTHGNSQLEAGPMSTDDFSFSLPLQYQEDFVFNMSANL